MKKIYILLFALSALVALTTSCKKDPYINIIPNEVSGNVNSFINEGKIRGINVELKGLKIVLSGKLINDYNGYYDSNKHEIYIDTTSQKYKWSPEAKEQLLFHELAHATLKRVHRDGNLPNGDPVSIMGTTVPWANWSGGFLFKRQYYVDELFNQNTPVPAWGI